jgi:hypothetical protein
MTSPDFPLLPLFILTFFAGFAAAIWLAVSIDKDARKIVEKAKSEEAP